MTDSLTPHCAVCGKVAPCVPHDIAEPGRTSPCIVSLCDACLATEIYQAKQAAAKAARPAKNASAEEPSYEQLLADVDAAFSRMKDAENAWRSANQRLMDWHGRNPTGRGTSGRRWRHG